MLLDIYSIYFYNYIDICPYLSLENNYPNNNAAGRNFVKGMTLLLNKHLI